MLALMDASSMLIVIKPKFDMRSQNRAFAREPKSAVNADGFAAGYFSSLCKLLALSIKQQP